MSDTREKLAVLVVEDEEAIRRGLCDVLAFHGYAPNGVGSGEEGLSEALTGSYDLVVLDVMLPGMSGFDVCAEVRAKLPAQPILMLTARGSEESVVEGFERGADDYLTKPFAISELLARVKALLRRAGRLRGEEGERFAFGAWEVDAANLRARRAEADGDGACVDLSARELAILALFAREEGRIVSRRTLLQEIWGYPNPDRVETRSVDMQIAKLRKKLDRDGESILETVRGAGYRYDAGAV